MDTGITTPLTFCWLDIVDLSLTASSWIFKCGRHPTILFAKPAGLVHLPSLGFPPAHIFQNLSSSEMAQQTRSNHWSCIYHVEEYLRDSSRLESLILFLCMTMHTINV
jgi:hypothetical protein